MGTHNLVGLEAAPLLTLSHKKSLCFPCAFPRFFFRVKRRPAVPLRMWGRIICTRKFSFVLGRYKFAAVARVKHTRLGQGLFHAFSFASSAARSCACENGAGFKVTFVPGCLNLYRSVLLYVYREI